MQPGRAGHTRQQLRSIQGKMPNYRRADVDGGTYFFTVNTLHRRPFLVHAEVRASLRMAIAHVRTTLPFAIEAWVLLPDHLHCLWTLPPGDTDFATRWRLIKTKVTQVCGEKFGNDHCLTERRKAKRQGSLWQNRYWEHLIRDERDFVSHVEYAHWNPVKHGLVQRVADWPFSSFHRYAREGIYPQDWGSVANVVSGEFGE